MKKMLLAVTLAFAANAAQAALVFTSLGTTAPTNQVNDITGQGLGTTFSYGTLSASAGDTIRFTNLGGAEAGFTNFFVNGVNTLSNHAGIGDYFDYTATTDGALEFSFTSQNGVVDSNGSTNIAVVGGLLGNQFVLLLDDGFLTHSDFDDHAIGVNQVPVPAALPLMASALGMFGVARRRKTLA
jgi:opacity protein-like surface antigen